MSGDPLGPNAPLGPDPASDPSAPPPRLDSLHADPAPAPAPQPKAQDVAPPPGDVVSAAFRQSNPIASVLDAVKDGDPHYTPDPNWNPLSLIRGTSYEANHLGDFLGDANEAQTRARMAKIDAEDQDRATLAASGWAGTVASIGAGLLDPTLYLPVVGEASLGLGAARTVAGTAARMAATGLLSSAASEALLQGSQASRPISESLGAVASGTILMGLLGAGAGAMLSRAEARAMAADLDRARAETPGAPADFAAQANAAFGLAADAGAAAPDVRTLTLKNWGVPDWLKATPYAGPAAEAVGWVLNRLSPTLRVFSSGSVIAKRAMADMAETPLVFEDNARGVPTSYGGPPLDRLIRQQSDQIRMGTNAALEDAFVDYRFGATPPKLAMARASADDLRGQSKGMMSFAEFKAQVSNAMYSGDVHPISQVQKAARELRRTFDRIGKLAQETRGPDGKPMLAQELGPPAGDQSYLPRVWNKEAIAARRNEVHGVFTDWLQRDQAAKAAIQERLGDLSTRHDALAGEVKKLDQRLETLGRRRAETEARLKERASETNRATDRADTLDERNAKIDAQAQELEQFLAESKSAVEARDADPVDRELYDNLKRDLASLRRARARNDIRAGEADIPVSANQDRFVDLADRQTRQQVMQDLLERARSNAEERRLALRERMEGELQAWEGKSAREAKAALEQRAEAERVRGLKQEAGVYAGKGARLGSADKAVDATIARILKSRRDLSREELGGVADEIIDRLLGSPDGRLSYDAHPTVGPPAMSPAQQLRGSLLSRDFAIPTALVHDFVEKDTQHLVSAYLRSVLPDVMLTQRFGDIEMRDVFRKINEEYAAKAKGLTSETALKALERERQGVIRDVAATRDRLRGVYGWSPDPRMRQAARFAGVARNWNLITDLGTSWVNRFGDAGANAVFRHGLMNVMHDVWRPMFKAMVGQNELALAYRAQAKAMAVGVDGALGHMAHDFGDVLDGYRPGSKFERGLAWAADRSMLVNMHGPWTDWTKTFVSGVAGSEILKAAERVALGTASAKDVERLAAASIDRATAVKIHEEFAGGGGSVIDGVPVPNTADWTSLQARQAFEAAIGREANIAVITPGMEKPLWMSSPIAGLIGQFKSFVAGAYERLLVANIQARDARTLQGLMVAVATGMLSYRLYTWISGAQASDNPADWIKEGVHRSAILAWLSEANEMQAKFTGGASDMYRLIGASSPLTRHDRGGLEELLGPTYSRLNGLTGALGDATRAVLPGDKPKAVWTAQDTHAIRKAMLFQNLFFVRRLFDEAEAGVNASLGVQQRPKAAQWK